MTNEKVLTAQLYVFVFPFWILVSPSIQKSIHCSDFEMTALPVSGDVEGNYFLERSSCYLCLLAVSSKPKSLLSISPKTKKNSPGLRTGDLQKATRKNWMDERITPEYSYCKWKQGMGQGWVERKGEKPTKVISVTD